MAKVRFTCDDKNTKIFNLSSIKELEYVPMVGDEIVTSNKDFMRASFRIKPWSKDKGVKGRNNYTLLNFVVKSRKYILGRDEWELLCEPTASSLTYLLGKVKV